jgi:hypothetical protein
MRSLQKSILTRWILVWALSPSILILLAKISDWYRGTSNHFSPTNLTECAGIYFVILILTAPLFMTGCYTSNFLLHIKQYSLVGRFITLFVLLVLVLASLYWFLAPLSTLK